MRVDHVIIGAGDIGPLRELLRDRYGFGVIQGSAHDDGTQGWLVPFDSPQVQYLELLTPGDLGKLSGSAFGRLFLERTAGGPAFLNWALLCDDIDKDADRVRSLTGADPGLVRGESVRADGQRFPWAEAAFDASWRCPSRPFFLEYGNWPARVGRIGGDLRRAAHRRTPLEFAAVTVRTAQPDLASWWGHSELPVVMEAPGAVEAGPGAEGIRAVRIRTADGDVEVVLP
ncbi:VOC family protein [Streptomyces sp. NPDC086519]|uniref:VOC family protein n=1 Tax=Streptomyces sp. NPDC086519 TaxID=3154863 RepID=UPI003431A8AE